MLPADKRLCGQLPNAYIETLVGSEVRGPEFITFDDEGLSVAKCRWSVAPAFEPNDIELIFIPGGLGRMQQLYEQFNRDKPTVSVGGSDLYVTEWSVFGAVGEDHVEVTVFAGRPDADEPPDSALSSRAALALLEELLQV